MSGQERRKGCTLGNTPPNSMQPDHLPGIAKSLEPPGLLILILHHE
jgi:hypothetical protein